MFRRGGSTRWRTENFRFTRFDQHDQSREISFLVGNCGETKAARVLEFFPCNVDRVVSNSNLICIGGRNGCLPTYKPEQLRAAGSVFARGFRRGGRERSGQIGHTAFLRILLEVGWYRGIVGGIPKTRRSRKGLEKRERYGATTLLRMHPV